VSCVLLQRRKFEFQEESSDLEALLLEFGFLCEKDDGARQIAENYGFYAAHISRWVSTDPTWLADGVNLYAYVHGNPVSGVDPSGTETVDDDLVKSVVNGDDASYEFKGLFVKGKGPKIAKSEKKTLSEDSNLSSSSSTEIQASTSMAPLDNSKSVECSAVEKTTKYLDFVTNHPIVAAQVGDYVHSSLNISTISIRFAASIDLEENTEQVGSQVNAFRHVLWQAILTEEFNEKIATQIGNVHECNPSALQMNGDPASLVFSNINDTDEFVDLLNNRIGRGIGKANPGLGYKQLAQKTLDYFRDNGLWMAVAQNDGTYKISQEKLSTDAYAKSNKNLNSRNEFGYTDKQWMERKPLKSDLFHKKAKLWRNR